MTSIYLAGPIKHAPDGGAWRESVIDDWPDVGWQNPLGRYDVPSGGVEIRKGPLAHSERDGGVVTVGELVGHDKEMIADADGVLVGFEDVQMVGTPMEVMFAYERDMPIALWVRDATPFDALSPWWRHHATCVTNGRDLAIEHLLRRCSG